MSQPSIRPQDAITDTPGSTTSLVPSGDGRTVPFDPSRSDRLLRQGLDFLLVRESTLSIEPAGSDGSGDDRVVSLPTHTVALLIQELAAAMVPSVAALVGDAEHLMAKQQTLALACIYACSRTSLPADSDARTQLGLLTDVVSDEHRFPWWRALPLQVALNITGEGNGGYRTLYGNLSHPNERVRTHLLPIAWVARRHLDAATVALAVLPNVATTEHGAASLAVLRACCRTDERFIDLVRAYTGAESPETYRERIAPLDDPASALATYVASPPDLRDIERSVRDEVLRVATTQPAASTGQDRSRPLETPV